MKDFSQSRDHEPMTCSALEVLRRVRSELFGLCEVSQDENYDRLQAPGLDDHEKGYLRGSRSEAKAIARAMGEVFRELDAALSSAEPAEREGSRDTDKSSPPTLEKGKE